MELVQVYLDKWQPAPRDYNLHRDFIGASRATITDGTDSVEFGFLDFSVERNTPNSPIYNGLGRMVQLEHGRTETKIFMTVLLDNNKVYELISRRFGQKITMQTENFRANGYVESVDYNGISMMSDDITARITINATDFKVL
jgi:hypothetical protein